MHLWIAEGFIQQAGHRFPEDVAEDYLEELIDRSLIQVARRRTDGGVKACRIHDLLRELCISESAEEMFLEVQSENHLVTNKSRRLSIQGNTRRYISLNPSVPKNARSLFFFSDTMYHRDKWSWVQKNFKLLRVLYDEKVAISAVLKSIPTFIHLRYLTINLNDDSFFPDSIYNLTNLETLYVKGNFCVGYLPKGIFKMQRLRNLYVPRGLLWLPCDLEVALGNLQVLSVASIIYDPQKHSFPVVLDKFPNVRKLKISIDAPRKEIIEAKEIVSFPSHLAHLEILRIDSCGNIRGIPNSIPSRITKLTIKGGVFKVSGGMTELEKLPNLRILKLEGDQYLSDINIHVGADSFPQLQVLKLSNLRTEEWKQERGAMPSLRHLVISGCNEFSSAPELLSLTTLRSVEVIECPRLATKLRELQTGVGFNLLIKD